MPEQTWTRLDPAAVHDPRRDFAADVLVGLSEKPKRLSSCYIYDDAGSALFQQITDLEEYYPTRTEHGILERHAEEIVGRTGGPLNLIDLGAGDGRKTRLLLDWLTARGADVCYVPIDISEAAVAGLTEDCARRYPDLHVQGIVAEYFDGIRWVARQGGRRNLVLFLGSNIGNFDKAHARAFLRQLWDALNANDEALVGFDLKKDIEILLAAYNDRDGVTAAFDKNLLARINRELGGTFDLDAFRHFATYNVFTGAMESYLVSLRPQTVYIEALHSSFHFEPWEPIHTEYSYKYLERDVFDLADHCGFEVVERFYDPRRWFCDALWRCEKG